MKTVGKRRPRTDLEAAGEFLKLVADLRQRLPGHRPFIRRGVYRFRTFEEAQRAALEAQAGHGDAPKKKASS